MKNKLVLMIAFSPTKEAILEKATRPDNFSFLCTYTWEYSEMEYEQKESRERANFHSKFKHIRIFGDSERWRRLCLVFTSKWAAVQFIQNYQHLKLPFIQYQVKEDYYISIFTNILTPLPFKHLKGVLLDFFNLEEENVDEVLLIACPLSQKALAAREQIENTFQQRLTDLFAPVDSSSTSQTPKFTHAQIERIRLVSQTLIVEAQAFDESENLGQNAISLALGNLFLSFNLRPEAIKAFKNVQYPALEYCLAQKQLTSLYMSTEACSSSPELDLSLDAPCSISAKKMIEECFVAALNAKEVILATASANILAGFDQEKKLFTTLDFAFFPTLNSYEMECWFKIFSTIRSLKSQLASANISPAVLHVFDNKNSQALTEPIEPPIAQATNILKN